MIGDGGHGARGELAQVLSELAEKGRRRLRAQRLSEAWSQSVATCAPLFVVAPALHAIQQGVRWIGGEGKLTTSWTTLALWTVAVPVAYLFARTLAAAFRPVQRRDALAWIDHALDGDDRLLVADEFLALEQRGPFHEAALDDGLAHARALAVRSWPAAEVTRAGGASRPWRWWLAAGAAIAFLGWLDWSARARASQEAELEPSLAALSRTTETPAEPPVDPEAGEQPPQPEPRERQKAVAGSSPNQERAHSSELSDWIKESEGKTGSGRSSQAESASAKSHSRGAPSNQGQVSKGRPNAPKPAAQKAQPKPPVDAEVPPKKESEEESGSTAGRGSSRGSNKNPAVSDWASKDQVSSPEDEEIEQDEETEDEDEEQESRGGIQPHLRDRKPPVSRDLQIGFGNRSSPDANGRGGPGEQKKSRGTASLVLGVPIPDRIKGQPNPGKTKITQERIEPRSEESDPIAAGERPARVDSFGVVPHAELDPWMRELVRAYFLSLRNPSTD